MTIYADPNEPENKNELNFNSKEDYNRNLQHLPVSLQTHRRRLCRDNRIGITSSEKNRDTYIRKNKWSNTMMGKCKQWNKDAMIVAVNAVREKRKDYKLASKAFQVPRDTLKDHVKSNISAEAVAFLLGKAYLRAATVKTAVMDSGSQKPLTLILMFSEKQISSPQPSDI
ncbi:hypothetical protein FQA39_LY04456 [Lamprigera yunnana]|nr:hypothetical protein FQA39_LY04456 [Lamprigera yunnana]